MTRFIHPTLIALLTLTITNTISGCGVKSAPTPVLEAPPSPLQQEVNRRAAEAAEQDKEKQKGVKRP